METPHVLVIPYPAQGHVIPLMELSQTITRHGIKVTFVNTESNHKKIMDSLASKDGIDARIRLLSVPNRPKFNGKSGLEQHFEEVYQFMPEKVKEVIEQINSSESEMVTCVLADHLLGWAMEIAAEMGIKRAAFSAAAATLLFVGSNVDKLIEDGIIDHDGSLIKRQLFQLTPTIPAINSEHLGWTLVGDTEFQKMLFKNLHQNNSSKKLSNWVLCNSSYSLEPATFDTEPKIIPIGPLLSSNQFGNLWPEDSTCLPWLDQQKPQSVIYVAFGSTTIFDQIQFQEVAIGLELCNRPFIWVVRPDTIEKMSDPYPYPSGFRNRVSGRGIVVNWAPQQKVLAHPAVACFVSHCGWNSTIEGLSNGIPFLCWPYFADQFHNKSYICDVWKVGLGLARDECGIIDRREICSKVEELLQNEKYRANVLAIKKKLICGVEEGGGSYNNLKNFVEWISS